MPSEVFTKQSALDRTIAKLGALPSYNCTPYLIDNIPRFGQHIAWSESSAAVFASSVLGARTNKEGGIGSIAAAITGKTADYGYHLDENRLGDLEVRVNVELHGIADYAVLGNFVAQEAGDKMPVLTGLDPSISVGELISLGTQMTTTGDISLFHAVGVTPEAPTIDAAFGHKRPHHAIGFGEEEYNENVARLSHATGQHVDLVIFGCPHASIDSIKEISSLQAGKRVHTGVEVWITTSRTIKSYAEVVGYVETIEASGAKVLADACPIYITMETVAKYGPRVVATDSGCVADVMPTLQKTEAYFGSTKKCVDPAVTGAWK